MDAGSGGSSLARFTPFGWFAGEVFAGGHCGPKKGENQEETQDKEQWDIADPERTIDIQPFAELNINDPMPGTAIPIVSLYN